MGGKVKGEKTSTERRLGKGPSEVGKSGRLDQNGDMGFCWGKHYLRRLQRGDRATAHDRERIGLTKFQGK